MRERMRGPLLIKQGITILLALLFLIPFYFVIINSLKSFSAILTDAASWPVFLHWSNYTRAWKVLNFPAAFMHSLIVTVFSNLGIVLISSMAAYQLVRVPNRLNRLLFNLFIAAMVIPFQSIMIPLVKVAHVLHLLGNFPGLIIAYWGFGVSLSVFLFHGFVKSIPYEIEESAVVDGCSRYVLFAKIVVPLMMPIGVTVVILNSLWIWNDFLLPLLFINQSSLLTIPLATNALFGQYTKQWDLALAALVLGVLPVAIFYLLMQKNVIEGITAGSVKG